MSARPRSLHRSIAALLALLVGPLSIQSCGSGKYNPLTVDAINELPPQRPAVITLSDPQIYSRETLVNDRRREQDYLKELLDQSRTATFEPQIRRDLRTLTSTVLQLQAAYDPLAGRQAERGEELAEIDQRIEETNRLQRLAEARAALIEAERRLDDLAAEEESAVTSLSAASEADASEGGAGDGEGSGSTEQTSSEDPEEAAAERQVKLELLRADVKEIEKLIKALPSVAEVRQTAVGSTPREVFRDRQAYRGELRGALSEVELDDAHDWGQNSLYRLQFRATVLPGKNQDKMGVVHLTLNPPKLSDAYVLELYKTWLGHVSFRLNQPEGDRLREDSGYLLLGMGLDNALFHSTAFKISDHEALRVPLPPDLYHDWKSVLEVAGVDDRPTIRGLIDGFRRLSEMAREFLPATKWGPCRVPNEETEGSEVESETDGDVIAQSPECIEQVLRTLARIEPYISVALRGLGDTNAFGRDTRDSIDELRRHLVDASETLSRAMKRRTGPSGEEPHSDKARSAAWEKNPCSYCTSCGSPSPSDPDFEMVPEVFKRAIRRDGNCEARGGADVYATAPVELAQQISTTLSAFRSFELAVALAASLPTQGVDAGASLNRLRATRTDLEARERLPLVVGFAERRLRSEERSRCGWRRWLGALRCGCDEPAAETECPSPEPEAESCCNRVTHRDNRSEDPQFGWIFGPQAMIDAGEERLRLRQPVVNHPVTADLSLPGWWPSIELELKTGWIGNWHGDDLLDPRSRKNREQTFPVFLPLNRADLDGLTEYLANEAIGGALPYTHLSEVTPDEIETCASSVIFLVRGANVWRSSTAYLNGLRASDVQVLPDMAGLEVTFEDIRTKLPRLPGSGGRAVLTVWTRNGSSSREVVVREPPGGCRPAKEPALKLALTGRALIAPALTAGAKVVQSKLPTAYHRLALEIRRDEADAEWVPGTQNVRVTPDAVTGVVNLGALQVKNGDFLQVRLFERPVEGKQGTAHAVDGKLVYYSTPELASAEVLSPQIQNLDEQILLRLPLRYDAAYPDLRHGKVKFGVGVVEGSSGGYTLSIDRVGSGPFPKSTAADADRLLRFLLKVEKDGKAITGNELKTFLAGKRAITLVLDGGAALPAVTGTVTVSSK